MKNVLLTGLLLLAACTDPVPPPEPVIPAPITEELQLPLPVSEAKFAPGEEVLVDGAISTVSFVVVECLGVQHFTNSITLEEIDSVAYMLQVTGTLPNGESVDEIVVLPEIVIRKKQ